MSTVKDYLSREADVAAFRGLFPSSREQLLAQELVSSRDGGALIAGVERLAQSALIILLLPKGSKAYAASEGCQFMLDARQGLWRTPADVRQSFNLSRADVRRQLQATESPSDPDDEKYGSFTLDGVTLAGDKVTLRMTLKSAAGDAYTFLTPITTVIR